MGAKEFYKLRQVEKIDAFREISEKQNLPPFTIEKDWWVTQTLSIIFELDFADQLVFKGGTSLSKAWNIINRFSEDIDLALSREYLGFDGSTDISKSQVEKLRRKSCEFGTNTFYESLQRGFERKGYEVTFEIENSGGDNQDPTSILIKYPPVTEYSEYVLPRVKVELGSRSLKEPFTHRDIQSFVGEQFPNLPFADTPISIPCVNPERTLLEKLFLLHEEFKKPVDKIRVDRLSRHLYDITKIYNSEHQEKIFDKELIDTIINHRRSITAIKGVDYDSLYPPHLNPIPPKEVIESWESDYKSMQDNMIPEESPSFTDILAVIEGIVDRYNKLVF